MNSYKEGYNFGYLSTDDQLKGNDTQTNGRKLFFFKNTVTFKFSPFYQDLMDTNLEIAVFGSCVFFQSTKYKLLIDNKCFSSNALLFYCAFYLSPSLSLLVTYILVIPFFNLGHQWRSSFSFFGDKLGLLILHDLILSLQSNIE